MTREATVRTEESSSTVKDFEPARSTRRVFAGFTRVAGEAAEAITLEMTWRWRLVRPMSPSGSW